ncbi:hypothetical protein RCL1_002886 [Eukaryota sp. TZLM3-RCL]
MVPSSLPIRLAGKVVRGFGRGKSVIGFPTANLDPFPCYSSDVAQLLPGVYSGIARVDDGECFPVSFSVGNNPTFSDVHSKVLEAYILHEFDSNFYDSTLTLLLLDYLAPQKSFSSIDELRSYISSMVDQTRNLSSLKSYEEFLCGIKCISPSV